jgi:hypothetical protein
MPFSARCSDRLGAERQLPDVSAINGQRDLQDRRPTTDPSELPGFMDKPDAHGANRKTLVNQTLLKNSTCEYTRDPFGCLKDFSDKGTIYKIMPSVACVTPPSCQHSLARKAINGQLLFDFTS